MNVYQQQTILKPDLIEGYIGSHAKTEDFKFQEQIRKVDLSIRDILTSLNEGMGKTVFTNGWGQIIAAVYLLNSDSDNLKISMTFKNYLIEHLNQALKCCDIPDSILKENVRGPSKSLLMYPHTGQYFDWKNAGVSESFVEALNSFLQDVKPQYSFYEGKLYLNLDGGNSDSTIFQRLWGAGFKAELEKLGFTRMQSNNEHPHITLINSDVIASIKSGFESKYGVKGQEAFQSFMNELVLFLNAKNGTNFQACNFGDFLSTYSEDYPPFEFCVVAQFNATYVERDLKFIVERVKQELNFEPKVKPKSSFHMTVGVEYREPASWPSNIADLKQILSQNNKMMKSISTKLLEKLV